MIVGPTATHEVDDVQDAATRLAARVPGGFAKVTAVHDSLAASAGDDVHRPTRIIPVTSSVLTTILFNTVESPLSTPA
jgi:hypothetical protein